MKKRMLYILPALIGLAGALPALAVPEITVTLDLQDPDSSEAITILEGTEPRIVVQLENDGVPYNDLNSYTGKLFIGTSATNAQWISNASATVDPGVGSVVFDLEQSETSTNGAFTAWAMLYDSAARPFYQGNFALTIEASTIATGVDIELDTTLTAHMADTNNPHSTRLQDLGDVSLGTPTPGESLAYTAAGTWTNSTAGAGDMLKSEYDQDNDGSVDSVDSIANAAGGTVIGDIVAQDSGGIARVQAQGQLNHAWIEATTYNSAGEAWMVVGTNGQAVWYIGIDQGEADKYALRVRNAAGTDVLTVTEAGAVSGNGSGLTNLTAGVGTTEANPYTITSATTNTIDASNGAYQFLNQTTNTVFLYAPDSYLWNVSLVVSNGNDFTQTWNVGNWSSGDGTLEGDVEQIIIHGSNATALVAAELDGDL